MIPIVNYLMAAELDAGMYEETSKPIALVITVDISSIICYLHACRHQNESKTRKYLDKVL